MLILFFLHIYRSLTNAQTWGKTAKPYYENNPNLHVILDPYVKMQYSYRPSNNDKQSAYMHTVATFREVLEFLVIFLPKNGILERILYVWMLSGCSACDVHAVV